MASVILVVSAYAATMDFSGGQGQWGHVSPTSTPMIFGLGVIAAVRQLRYCLLVTDDRVIQRGGLWGWELPWSAVTGASRPPHWWFPMAEFGSGSIRRYSFQRDRALMGEVAEMRLRQPPAVGDLPTVKRNQRARRVRGGLLLAAATVAVFGAVSIQTGRADQARWAARAVHDRTTYAHVVDWKVHEVPIDGGEFGPDSRVRTDATVQFTALDGTPVSAELQRWGDHPRPETDLVEIVYDSAAPTDIDWADRPDRQENDRDVNTRLRTGPPLLLGGLVGLTIMAMFCLLVPLPAIRTERRPVTVPPSLPPPPRVSWLQPVRTWAAQQSGTTISLWLLLSTLGSCALAFAATMTGTFVLAMNCSSSKWVWAAGLAAAMSTATAAIALSVFLPAWHSAVNVRRAVQSAVEVICSLMVGTAWYFMIGFWYDILTNASALGCAT